jgi:threonine/homoserine/homoserine lactone efflux protein
MLSWHAFLIYAWVYAIFIAVPGPGIVGIVARALGSGFRAALPATAGIAISHFIMITLSTLGLAVIAERMGGMFLIVKLAGAAYLIYMGVRYWRAPVEAELSFAPETPRQSFVSQLTISLGNPKAIAFFVALLPAVVDLRTIGTIGYLQLLAVCVLVMPPIILSYAALASKMRRVLADEKARGRMNKGAGLIMMGAGAGVAAS